MATTRILNMDDSSKVSEAGRLLKFWIDNDSAPTDGAVAKAELEAAGLVFASTVEEVNIHPYKPNSIEIGLPNKDELNERLGEFSTQTGRDNYELPDPFENQVDRELNGPPQTEQDLIDFYLFRLGDYALQHCQ